MKGNRSKFINEIRWVQKGNRNKLIMKYAGCKKRRDIVIFRILVYLVCNLFLIAFFCIDINECEEYRHDCQHKCNNTNGSFVCECYSGYSLAADGHTCTAEYGMRFHLFTLGLYVFH